MNTLTKTLIIASIATLSATSTVFARGGDDNAHDKPQEDHLIAQATMKGNEAQTDSQRKWDLKTGKKRAEEAGQSEARKKMMGAPKIGEARLEHEDDDHDDDQEADGHKKGGKKIENIPGLGRKALKDEMIDKRNAFEDKRQENRGKLKEGKKEFVQKQLDITSGRFSGVTKQFDTILAKLGEFVATKKVAGVKVADAEAALLKAKSATDAAKSAVAKVAEVNKTVAGGAPDKVAIKTAVEAANTAIKAAHSALKAAGDIIKAL